MKNFLLPVEYPNLLLAPNAFKGSLDAREFCRILTEELTSPLLYPLSLPMCDGGDGTAGIIAFYLQAYPIVTDSYDALGRKHQVTYYRKENTAILDLAEICGLKHLKPEEYDVLNASTAGLGIVLKEIVGNGCKQIVLGLGGSASIDGGTGALREMGLKIVKTRHLYNNDLIDIKEINSEQLKLKFKDIDWFILCDVNNPLLGPEGAPSVFGPQKGASHLQISLLDDTLRHYAGLLFRDSGKDVTNLKHGGAAGGVAAAFSALLNARLVSGAEYCLQLSGFEKYLKHARCVITGEGKLDTQTFCGKIPGEIVRLCRLSHVPVCAIAGLSDPLPGVFDQIYTLASYAGNLTDSLRYPDRYLRLIARDLQKNILKLI